MDEHDMPMKDCGNDVKDSMKDRDTRSYPVEDVRENQARKTPGSHVFTDIEKKSEKIVTAIYMVTDCIEKEDPIKDSIRKLSVQMMTEIHALSLMSESESHTSLTRSTHYLDRILSFINLAVRVGYVSDMNYMILENALNFLKEELSKRQDSFISGRAATLVNRRKDIEQFQLPKDLFGEEELLPEPKQESVSIDEHKKENKPEKQKIRKVENAPKPKDLNTKKKESVEAINQYLEKKKQFSVPNIEKKVSKINPRQERLVGLIRQKREVSVTDLKDNFPEISSKTIQRDLAALVSQGTLKKEGEKRWSKYSLKD